MLSDLRLAFRQMAKAPGFTGIIVLTLALSIGACTAIYSALDRIVLNPFDDPATKRNLDIRSVKLPERTEGGLSYPDFIDLEKRATSFEFMVHFTTSDINLTGTAEPMRLRRNVSTPGFFEMFGIKLALGRAFERERQSETLRALMMAPIDRPHLDPRVGTPAGPQQVGASCGVVVRAVELGDGTGGLGEAVHLDELAAEGLDAVDEHLVGDG